MPRPGCAHKKVLINHCAADVLFVIIVILNYQKYTWAMDYRLWQTKSLM